MVSGTRYPKLVYELYRDVMVRVAGASKGMMTYARADS